MLKILKNQFFWLSFILLLAFLLRIYKIDAPIADWHSWRQVDTAAVTRNFVKMNFNPFLPRFDDMTGISDPPIANIARYRFVEFPIYNIFVYPLYLLFGIDEKYHRLVSVIFSLGSIVFLYLIVKKYAGLTVAFFTSLTYALLPFNVFFSRTTLPEPTFVFFALGMVYFVDRWIWEQSSNLGILGFVFTSIAFLMKPWALFFYLPLIYSAIKAKVFKNFLFFSIFAFLPFLIWRLWILQAPQGIPASSWLMNGDGIRLRPAFWWWIISERLGNQILTVPGFALFIFGIITRPIRGYFLHLWLLSMFLYMIIFATGNVRHDYYQYIFVPIAVTFLAVGLINLIKGENIYLPRIFTILIGFTLYILSIYFGFTHAKGLYQINNPVIVEAGIKVNQILPSDAIVVAPYNGDSAFLYQTNRHGFSVAPLPLTQLVSDYGVTHYVSTTRDDQTNWVLRHFEILEDNPRFIIADLRKIVTPIGSDPQL